MKDGFDSLGLDLKDSDGISIGKGLDSLKNSEQVRKILEARFGGTDNRYLPSSIMKAIKLKREKEFDEAVAGRNYRQSSSISKVMNETIKRSKKLQEKFDISGQGCGSGALSTFPQNIGKTMVLFYTDPGQTVVDPFAGHCSRVELVVKENRNYIGCDLSAEFMKYNNKRAETLRKLYPKSTIELHHCDSPKMPIKSGVGDYTVRSPPYYDIEYYGDEPEQLGKCKTYEEFLEGMQLVMNENFRCLKPGAYACWFINDFRRKKVMHFYHVDILNLGKNAGFIAHDLLVVDFGPGLRDAFLNQAIQTKILPKRNEFGIIFRKPKDKDGST